MNIIVTTTAQSDQILEAVRPALSMFFDMVEFENSWVGLAPTFSIPTAELASIVGAFVNLLLNIVRNLAIMGLGYSLCALPYFSSALAELDGRPAFITGSLNNLFL